MSITATKTIPALAVISEMLKLGKVRPKKMLEVTAHELLIRTKESCTPLNTQFYMSKEALGKSNQTAQHFPMVSMLLSMIQEKVRK